MNKSTHSLMVLVKVAVISVLLTTHAVSSTALQIADAAYSAHDVTKAIQQYQIALKNNPDSVEAKLGLAKCYERKGYTIASTKLIDEVLLQMPSNEDARILKSVMYLKEDNLDEAYQLLNSVLQANPESINAHSYLAQIYSKKGDFKAANAMYSAFDALRKRDMKLMDKRP